MDRHYQAIVDAATDVISRLLQGDRVQPVEMPDSDAPECVQRLVETTNQLLRQQWESRDFLAALSQGNLRVNPPPRNALLSPFKGLHSNLRHLVWQTQQVAQGDLSQHVDFLGTFSDAFNSMIESLREKRRIEEELLEANKTILDGIHYALTIQTALLPREEEILRTTPAFFTIWQPRDVIGGDLYAFKNLGKGFLVAVMDCTGHGVPGAVMTMIAATCFQRAVIGEGGEDPARVLGSLNRLVKETLSQRHRESLTDDGLDIGLCYVNLEQRLLTFAGAKIGLFVVTDRQVEEILPDKHSVGYRSSRPDYAFTNRVIGIAPDATYYLTTDGLTDQIGGPRCFPFGKTRFKKLLSEMAHIPMNERKASIKLRFEEWRGQEHQVDDLTCVGFSVGPP